MPGFHGRRDFLRGAGAAFVLGSRVRAASKRPNILILFGDDQRHDTIGALNNREIRTPHLDRLIRSGTAFTNAHIMGGNQGAVCVPSRAMLLSGQSLFRATDCFNALNRGGTDAAACTLFPELLRQAGYTTFGTGKWHNGEQTYARCFTAGGNIFFGGMSDHDRVPIADFDPAGRYPRDKRRTADGFSSELFSDAAVNFLRGHKGGNPFLAYVSYTAPHDPRTPPKTYADMYPPQKIALPKNFLPEHPFDNGDLKLRDENLAPWPRTPEIIREHIAAYYGMITHMDAQIGRVLDTLEETGHARHTIVIFAADNGLAVGQHGLLGKQNLYDHSLRVPLIFSGPGIPGGRRVDSLCYLYDIYPTLCRQLGLSVPSSVEGIDLAPALKHPRAPLRSDLFFAYRHFQRGVRSGNWKLMLYNVGGQITTQLFDTRSDPWEMENLAGRGSQAARVRELTALLKDWMKRTGDSMNLDLPNWGHRPLAG